MTARRSPMSFEHEAAVVMMDTRDPHATAAAIAQPGFKLRRNASVYYFLTYYLNLRYAERHGYEIIYYRMDGKECQHPLWGARHPSYCKLAAIAHTLALRRHRWVVWIDSDAFIRNVSLPLPALLRSYGAPAEDTEDMAVYFGWDSPYTLGPNAGFAVLRNAEASTAMLQTWWNVYSGQYGLEHSYEQHTLQWQVVHLQAYRRRLQTLSLRTMEPDTPDSVVHLDHNAGTKTRRATPALLTCIHPHAPTRPCTPHARLHTCIPAPLHLSTVAPLHRCTAAPLHTSTSDPLHLCNSKQLHPPHPSTPLSRLWTMAAAAARLLEESSSEEDSPEGTGPKKWRRALISLHGASSDAVAPHRALEAVVRAATQTAPVPNPEPIHIFTAASATTAAHAELPDRFCPSRCARRRSTSPSVWRAALRRHAPSTRLTRARASSDFRCAHSPRHSSWACRSTSPIARTLRFSRRGSAGTCPAAWRVRTVAPNHDSPSCPKTPT